MGNGELFILKILEGRILGLLYRRLLEEKNAQSDSWGKSGFSRGLFSVKID